ncbi:MAG: M20/M25/M40 family metallo-hydrolase, partial [Anaerolineae bacterium]|nr:M20/M25/M40 family metallo-hydrolase [Anaerolineae bacterium]
MVDADAVIGIVADRAGELQSLLADLVSIPSENIPPGGQEGRAQAHVAGYLKAAGLEVATYEPTTVPGLREHPLFWPHRDYRGRPNVTAVLRGAGGGRSLLFTGHIDTVPRGTIEWPHNPFTPRIQNGRMYGLGTGDMKAGVAIAMFVARVLKEAGVRLRGDLIVESVVDEEFGGVNGTLAGRLHGPKADGAILVEPTGLQVYPGARGCTPTRIYGPQAIAGSSAGRGGSAYRMEVSGEPLNPPIAQLQHLLARVGEFNALRQRSAPRHPLWAAYPNPVPPVLVTKAVAGFWGWTEPVTIPMDFRLELYWELLPGESEEKAKGELMTWLHEAVAAAPHLFSAPPRVEFPIRYMPATAIASGEPIVQAMAAAAEATTGARP